MSALADWRRETRRRSMLPGSQRDRLIAVARIGFPVAAGLLAIVLIALPLLSSQEFSFLLSKDSAEKSDERMRMLEVTYRGETAQGEPFSISAHSGVQRTSSVPVVVLQGLHAEITRESGPASVSAPSGEFLINENRVLVNGPITLRSTSGYSLDGDRIMVDINAGTVATEQPVSGTIPMGAFSADRFSADIEGRRFVLDGGASLRITPARK